MTKPAIVIETVAKQFGSNEVLRELSLEVPAGQTFAFLGRNGSGKTTTIRMLMGLLKPDAGSIRVLGLDPRRDEMQVRQCVGYLAEDQTMFGWMRVEELIGFVAPFYPTWDHELATHYLRQFELPPRTKVKHLSKGQNVRLGLLLALAHRPKLVVLDDPALGLDPIMRKEFNRDLISNLQGEGRTIFYSSHLLYEVEPIADSVAILDGGVIVKHAPTETLRQEVKQIILDQREFYARRDSLEPLDVRYSGDQVAVTVDRAPETIAALQASDCPHRVVDLSLDEIFEAYVVGSDEAADASPPQTEAVPQSS